METIYLGYKTQINSYIELKTYNIKLIFVSGFTKYKNNVLLQRTFK